jgi:VanZ family protein
MFLTSLSKKQLFGSLLIVWMIVIFALSSISGVVSPYESPLWFVLERKGAHVIEYLVLAVFAGVFFSTYPWMKRGGRVLYWMVFLFSTAYALSDEIHQFFVFGRQARFTDICIDDIGVVLGMTVFFLWQRKRLHIRLLGAYRSLRRKTSR